jgi:predicted MFS family arabinose efflux permease
MLYRAALDWLNFFLADVRGGLGPYVSVFLLTEAQWNQAQIGAVLTISGLIGISLHVPIGAFIDATRYKRGLLVAGVGMLAAAAVAIERMPTWPVVLAADIVMAVLGAIFAPTVAAITLGLVDPHGLPERFGRNAAFDRAGNLLIAGLVGPVGRQFSQHAVFYLVPFIAAVTSPSYYRSLGTRSTTSGRVAASPVPRRAMYARQAGACWSRLSRCWCSGARPHSSTSRMRPCYLCSDKSWRLPIPARRPC